MLFPVSLVPGTLLRRYKRFLADVELDDGSVITAHSPNTGSMLGCADPGLRVWLRDAANPRRKYRWSWEISRSADGTMVGINTLLSNGLVAEGIESGLVKPLQGYDGLRREVRYGQQNSRIDLLLEADGSRRQCYVEVKNVTASVEPGVALFPDAVSQRGTKHLNELMHIRTEGQRAIIFFCAQRDDVTALRPADEIDPVYGETLRAAVEKGVEAMAYRATVTPRSIVLTQPIEIVL